MPAATWRKLLATNETIHPVAFTFAPSNKRLSLTHSLPNADVTPGDIYTIYRMNRPGLPPVVLGELAVLSVHSRSSVAKILRSRYTIFVGDRIDPK